MFRDFFDKINPYGWLPSIAGATREISEDVQPQAAILQELSEDQIPPTPPVKAPAESPPPAPRSEKADYDLSASNFAWNFFSQIFDGEKYPGGMNQDLDFFYIDYWSLRRRSYKLFTENRYAAGLIKRLLTNEIHRGLILEATPISQILGITTDTLNDWSDDVEAKFGVWGEDPDLVSYDGLRTFGQIQYDVRKTALLSGDCLVVLRQHSKSQVPVIQLIDGGHVRTPLDKTGNSKIKSGVELDAAGRQIAYYVQDTSDALNMKSIRIPAFGRRTGRRVAWMVYGHKIRINDVRGMPALGIILQALKELDRYSDAEQRSAVINSILALFFTKDRPGIGTRPMTGGAKRYDAVGEDSSTDTSISKQYNIASHSPGIILDQLPMGVKPESFNTVRPNVNYRVFEEAMMASFAWANEIPPNIYRLAFSSNYSASGGEINEFKMYLDRIRADIAADFNKPFYKEWLISMVLRDAISAPELLEAWRNPQDIFTAGAWFASEWAGAIKPSLRRILDIKAYVAAIKEGLATRDMACKEIWGRKFTTIIRRLNGENKEFVKGIQPLIDAGLISVTNNQTELSETTG